MNLRGIFPIGVVVLLVTLATLSGCRPVKRDNIIFHRMQSVTLEAPSDRVIEATRQVIAARKLRVLNAKASNLDAEYYVNTALGTRMIILIVATGQQQTKVQFLIGGRRDTTLAALILEEIRNQSGAVQLQ